MCLTSVRTKQSVKPDHLLKSGIINKVNKMSYDEIMQALKQGLTVCFSSSIYVVILDNDKLHTLCTRNGYYIALHEDEYQDCFIKGVI